MIESSEFPYGYASKVDGCVNVIDGTFLSMPIREFHCFQPFTYVINLRFV